MAWEYAAIVRLNENTSDSITNESRNPNFSNYRLVKPGKDPNPPRINFDLVGMKNGWSIPVNKPYWAFTDVDEAKLEKAEGGMSKMAFPGNPKGHTYSIDGKSRIILFESPDLLTLIDDAGKEGWEITGGIGIGSKQSRNGERKYRMMRRTI